MSFQDRIQGYAVRTRLNLDGDSAALDPHQTTTRAAFLRVTFLERTAIVLQAPPAT